MVNKTTTVRFGGQARSIDDRLRSALKLCRQKEWGELARRHPWDTLMRLHEERDEHDNTYADRLARLMDLRAYAALRKTTQARPTDLQELEKTVSCLEIVLEMNDETSVRYKPGRLLTLYIRRAQTLVQLGLAGSAQEVCEQAFEFAKVHKVGATLERGVLHLVRANIALRLEQGLDRECAELVEALAIFRGAIKKQGMAQQFIAITHLALAALRDKQKCPWAARWQRWRARRFMSELESWEGKIAPLESGEVNLTPYVATSL